MFDYSSHRRVIPMHGSKGVDHIDIRQLSQVLCKTLVIFLFLSVKSEVFKEYDISRVHLRHHLFDTRSDTVRRK